MVARTIIDANNELLRVRATRSTNLDDAKRSLSKSEATEVFGDLYKLQSLLKQRDIAQADNLGASTKELDDRIQILCKKLAKNKKVLGKFMNAYQEDLYRNEGKELRAMRGVRDAWNDLTVAARDVEVDFVVPDADEIARMEVRIQDANINLHTRKEIMTDLANGADSDIFKLLVSQIPQDKLSEKQLAKRNYRMDDATCDKAYKKAADKVDGWLNMKAQEAQSDADLTASKNARPVTKAALKTELANYKKVGGVFRFFKRLLDKGGNTDTAYKGYLAAKDNDKAAKKAIKENQKLYDRAQKDTVARRKSIDGKISSSIPSETNRSMQEYIRLNEGSLVTADDIEDARSDFRSKFNALRDVHKGINADISTKINPVAPAAAPAAPVAGAVAASVVPPPPANNAAAPLAQPQANIFNDDELDAFLEEIDASNGDAPQPVVQAQPAAPADIDGSSAAVRAAAAANDVDALLDELSEGADLNAVNANRAAGQAAPGASVALPAASAAAQVPPRSAARSAAAARQIVDDGQPEALPGDNEPVYQVGDLDVSQAAVNAAREGLRTADNERGEPNPGALAGGYSGGDQSDDNAPAAAAATDDNAELGESYADKPRYNANFLQAGAAESNAQAGAAQTRPARPVAAARPVGPNTMKLGAHALPSIRPQLRTEPDAANVADANADIDEDALEAEIAADADRDADDLQHLERDVRAKQDMPVAQQVEELAAEMNPGKALQRLNNVFSMQLSKLDGESKIVPSRVEGIIRTMQKACQNRQAALDAFEAFDAIEQHQDFSSHMGNCLEHVRTLKTEPNPAKPESIQAKGSRMLEGLKEFHADWANKRGLGGPEQARAQRSGHPPAGSRNMASASSAGRQPGANAAPKVDEDEVISKPKRNF